MFEPITILTGFLTMWAQLNNYGIDTEKYPHLKNVRVRRDVPLNNNMPLKDSIIMKNIHSARLKREAYNGMNMQNDYVETIIPLANWPPESEYYSQNTAGVPYYYNAYNGNNNELYGNNNGFNGNNNGLNGNNHGFNGNNNGFNGNNNGYNTPKNGMASQRDTPNDNYQRSGKLVTYTNGIDSNQGTIADSNPKLYNPFQNNNILAANKNANNNIDNNGNNNGLNNGNNSISNGKKNETVLTSSFMGSAGCSETLKSIKILGTSICMSDDY